MVLEGFQSTSSTSVCLWHTLKKLMLLFQVVKNLNGK